MSDIQEYKCPSCGGAIEFDSKSQKMKCPYCDTEFEIDAVKEWNEEVNQQKPEEMKWEESAGGEWKAGETDGMRVYSCQSCGGEIVGDENMAATSCPYCGNQVVLKGQFSGDLRPDYVIPFKLDKKRAKDSLKEHIKGKRLLPKTFKDENHIDEIKGIYVPFWLFDADVDADIQYDATKVRMWSDKNYDYTETKHYSVWRGGEVAFDHVPVDGSSQMPDDLMESIEPYQFSDAVDFQTAYMAGYLADRYDVEEDKSITRANERVKKSTEDVFRSTVQGYASVISKSSNIRLSNGKAKYALYPVWILNTSWKGKNYLFAMNGQTGKFVGDLPVDKRAFWRWTAGLTIPFSVIAYLVLSLFLR